MPPTVSASCLNSNVRPDALTARPPASPAEPSASQALHNLFGLAGYLFAPATLFALGLAARRWRDGAHLSWLGRVAAVPALVGLLALEAEYAGAAQRLLEGSVLVWVTACALYLGRRALNRR